MRTVIALLLVFVGCGGGDPDGEGHWQLLGSSRTSSLLAAWASGVDDAWIVGGREGLGTAPVAYHFDGTAWTRLDTGLVDVDLWQVFGFADGTVFLGGSNGTIVRYRAGEGLTPITTPTTDTVFGLWGSASSDVWAVGGTTTGRAFVWHYTGTAFESVPGVPSDLATGTVWKVTGRTATDVWMSCSKGMVLHWDGQALSNESIGTTEQSLFSIGCSDTRCVTAGTNLTNGVLYVNEGAGWTSRVPTLDGPVWRGVTPTGANTYVVGLVGAVIRADGDQWVSEPHGLTVQPLHAVWSTPDAVFAVGGQFDRAITTDGVALFKGAVDLPPLP